MEEGSTENSGANRYSAGERLFSNRTSEIYSATDSQVENRKLLLIRSRFPVEEGSKETLDKRLANFENQSNLLPNVVLSGIDVQSHLYVIFDTDAETPIGETSADVLVKERLFLKLVEKVAAAHEAGVVFGDISSEVVLVNKRDEISLIGVLGVFEFVAKLTAMLPNKESLNYLSPEHQAGGTPSKSGDVYAVGILGYLMFTSRFPGGDTPASELPEDLSSIAPAPSSVNLNVPFWLDDVLGTALAHKPDVRFRDAKQMLDLIQSSKSSGAAPGGLSRWSRKTVVVREETAREVITKAVNSDLVKSANTPDEFDEFVEGSDKKSSKVGLIFFGFLLLLAGAVAVYFATEGGGSLSELDKELKISEALAPAEIRPALNDLKASGVPVDIKLKALERIAESKDGIVFSLLATIMQHSKNREIANKASELVVKKLDQLNYSQTSNVLGEWFAGINRLGKNPGRASIFKSLIVASDPGGKTQERIEALNNVVSVNVPLGLQLAASLSLDTRGSKEFLPEFRRLLKEKSGVKDTKGKSIYSLLIADKTMLALFEREIRSFLEEFSPSELAWAMDQLSGQGHALLFDVAKELVKRDIVPRYQSVFLDILVRSNEYNISAEVRAALVKGAKGEFNRESINSIGRWYDMKAEQALLAVCALKGDEEIGAHSLSTLAARSINTEPARSLVGWTKRNFWKYKKKIAKSVGILGLSNIATDEELEFAMNRLIPFAGSKQFLKLIQGTNNKELLSLLIKSIGSTLPSSDLIDLTSNSDPEIRIAVVKAMKGRNDLHVLKEIYQAYKNEKDEDVRKVYEELHWVTKDRGRDF